MKLLRFQRTFPEKSFVSGFGADSLNIQCTAKKHGNAVLFNLSLYVGTAFQTSFSYFSYKKSKQKNFPPTTSLYLGESF